MATHLRVIQEEKVKRIITQAMARTMQNLSDFVFINMVNIILLRRNSYLEFVRHGVKVDTVAALRNSPLNMTSLFPDDVISKAEEEIGHHEDKQHSGSAHKKSDWYHPYNPSAREYTAHQPEIQSTSMERTHRSEQRRSGEGLKLFTATSKGSQGKALNYSQRLAKCHSSY